jgi:hypothetical protein
MTFRKRGGTLNEKIAKAQYCCFPEYIAIKKTWEKNADKGNYCLECVLLERFRMYRDSSTFFQNIKQEDTIYIIESQSIPSGNFWLMIWNKVDTVSFYNDSGDRTIKKTENNLHTKCLIQLIGRWDVHKIKEEAKKYEITLEGGINYATRIIIKKKKYKIDCFHFFDFYRYDRDKWDRIPTEYHPQNIPKCGE